MRFPVLVAMTVALTSGPTATFAPRQPSLLSVLKTGICPTEGISGETIEGRKAGKLDPISHVAIVRRFTPDAPTFNTQNNNLRASAPNFWNPQWSTVWATCLLAVIALFQAVMFFFQLKYMRTGIDDAKKASEAAGKAAEAAILGQRARIQITPTWETDLSPGASGRDLISPSASFKFGSKMDNVGHLPATNVTNRIDYQISDGDIPDHFAFPDDVPPMTGAGVINTRQSLLGPHVPPDRYISSREMEQIQKDEIKLHLFGWVKYRDGFPDTPERVTRFCYQVRVTRNPNHPVTFIPHPRHNYSD